MKAIPSLNHPKVIHVCPTYFDPQSVIAGAERYSYELAKAMSKKTSTTLVTFGPRSFVRQENGLTVKCFKPLFYVKWNQINPFSVRYLVDLIGADVIHCHQFTTFTTDAAILLAVTLRKKLFVTDLGGGTNFSLAYHLPLWKGIRALLLISNFNRNSYRNLPIDAQIIYGGVDPSRFSPGATKKEPRVLHVGRILPHKGIHDLIEALPSGVGLDVIGQAYAGEYYQQLQDKSRDRMVMFHTNLSDNDMIEFYRRALATVLPATADSGFTTALESFACGTPVIASRVGSLPELIEDGITGFLIPPNDRSAIREKISILVANPNLAREMGIKAREAVLKRFTWDLVADRCLKAYGLSDDLDHDSYA